MNSFVIEFESRSRILRDSVNIIESTCNIETLNSRFNVAFEHFEWIFYKKIEGYPIVLEGEDLRSGLPRVYNNGLLRIAEKEFNSYNKKILSLKGKDAIRINTYSFLEKINMYKNLIKDHESKGQIANALNNIHFKAQEIFSNLYQ